MKGLRFFLIVSVTSETSSFRGSAVDCSYVCAIINVMSMFIFLNQFFLSFLHVERFALFTMRGSYYVFNIKRIASGSSRLLMAVFSGMPNTYSSYFSTEVSLYTAQL
jgi:hypothetical protein